MAAVEPKSATPPRQEQGRGGGRPHPQGRGRPQKRGGGKGGGYAKSASPAHRSIAATQPATRWSPVD